MRCTRGLYEGCKLVGRMCGVHERGSACGSTVCMVLGVRNREDKAA